MFNICTLNSFKDVEVSVHLNKKGEIKFKFQQVSEAKMRGNITLIKTCHKMEK